MLEYPFNLLIDVMAQVAAMGLQTLAEWQEAKRYLEGRVSNKPVPKPKPPPPQVINKIK